MKGSMRQSNSWLHSWAGLLLGWLMFAIFVTGTISFFRQEVTFWMQPELHRAEAAPDAAQKGLDKLARVAPDAQSWTINLPSERNPTVRVSWRTDERGGEGRGPRQDAATDERQKRPLDPQSAIERAEAEAAAERANERGGRRRSPTLTLDPASGAVLSPRETAGGEFLYHLHYQLYAMPREWGRWIVGIATFAMFVALISGIITHKKIFADFFTFRRNKGQRSWLDAHNAVAVLSLPFHIMITFSGLLLLGGTLLPWGADAVLGDNRRGAEARSARASQDEPVQSAASTIPIADAIARGEAIWGQAVGRVTIERPGKSGSTIQLASQRNASLLQRPGGGPGRTLTLDAASGSVIEDKNSLASNPVEATDRVFASLHLGRFAPWGLRWLLFVAGIMGTAMVATGLVLWTVKRAEKRRGAPAPFGHRLVEHLNIGAITGLMIATAGYFWLNRLVPAGLAGRVDHEAVGFFLIWVLTFLHPLLRPAKQAWREQLALGGLLFAALPLLNPVTGGSGLVESAVSGNWLVAGFDLVCLATGAGLLAAAAGLQRRRSRDGRRPDHEPATTILQPAE